MEIYKVPKSVIINDNEETGKEIDPTQMSDALKIINSLSALVFCFFFKSA